LKPIELDLVLAEISDRAGLLDPLTEGVLAPSLIAPSFAPIEANKTSQSLNSLLSALPADAWVTKDEGACLASKGFGFAKSMRMGTAASPGVDR
jgi:hypothetical protein